MAKSVIKKVRILVLGTIDIDVNPTEDKSAAMHEVISKLDLADEGKIEFNDNLAVHVDEIIHPMTWDLIDEDGNTVGEPKKVLVLPTDAIHVVPIDGDIPNINHDISPSSGPIGRA